MILCSLQRMYWNSTMRRGSTRVNVLTMPGKRLFLTGDEAVARAALEAGVEVATGYPGNPSTKAITALIPIAQRYGIAVEWSVNEKVALEVATGAAWAVWPIPTATTNGAATTAASAADDSRRNT